MNFLIRMIGKSEMPDNARTSDSVVSLEPGTPSAMTDPENRDEVSAPESQASTPSNSTPIGANADQQARIEVTCGGCRRGLRHHEVLRRRRDDDHHRIARHELGVSRRACYHRESKARHRAKYL